MLNFIFSSLSQYKIQVYCFFAILFFLIFVGFLYHLHDLNAEIDYLSETLIRQNEQLILCKADFTRAKASLDKQNEAIKKLEIKANTPKIITRYKDRIQEIKIPIKTDCKAELNYYQNIFKEMSKQ